MQRSSEFSRTPLLPMSSLQSRTLIDTRGIDTMTLEHTVFRNENPDGYPNETFSFGNWQAKEQTKTLSTSKTTTWGETITISVSLDIGIPFLVDEKTSISSATSYESSTMDGTSTSNTDSLTLVWSQIGTIGPQRASDCIATSVTGHFSVRFFHHSKILLHP